MSLEYIRLKSDPDQKKSAILAHSTELQADIISKRPLTSDVLIEDIVNPSMKEIPVTLLSGVEKSSSRLVKAIQRSENIAIICPFQVDSTTAASLIDYAMVNHFNHNHVCSKIYFNNKGHQEGYSEQFVTNFYNEKKDATLIIALSANPEEVKNLANLQEKAKRDKRMLDIICIDNSSLEDDFLSGVYSYINPKQKDCNYPDKNSSVTVLALMMLIRLRKKLVDRRILREPPRIGDLTPFGAIASIASLSNIKTPFVRAIVSNGLKAINSGKLTNWDSYKAEEFNNKTYSSTATLEAGLLDDIRTCTEQGGNEYYFVKFLQCEDKELSMLYLNKLREHKGKRKNNERTSFTTANYIAEEHIKEHNYAFVFLNEATKAMHENTCRKFIDKYGKPSGVYSGRTYSYTPITFEDVSHYEVDLFKEMPDDFKVEISDDEFLWVKKNPKSKEMIDIFLVPIEKPNEMKSLRISEAIKLSRKSIFKGIKKGVYEFDIPNGKIIFDLNSFRKPKLSIQNVVEFDVTIMLPLAFRGRGVFGEALKLFNNGVVSSNNALSFTQSSDEIDKVREFLEKITKDWSNTSEWDLKPIIKTDGELPEDVSLNLQLISEIEQLEPYGAGFSYPIYEFKVTIDKRSTAEGKLNLRVRYRGLSYDAVWRNFENSHLFGKLKSGKEYVALAKPIKQYKNDKLSVLLDIVDMA